MRLPRRSFLGLIPVSALSLQLTNGAAKADESVGGVVAPLITSPPVVQHPSSDGFTVHFAVSALATGWATNSKALEVLARAAASDDPEVRNATEPGERHVA